MRTSEFIRQAALEAIAPETLPVVVVSPSWANGALAFYNVAVPERTESRQSLYIRPRIAEARAAHTAA